jgi:hypothetical protein
MEQIYTRISVDAWEEYAQLMSRFMNSSFYFQYSHHLSAVGNDYSALFGMFHRIHVLKRSKVTILVTGGSLTAGNSCYDETPFDSFKLCCWVNRFAHWLQLAYPDIRISVINTANGGTTSPAAIPTISYQIAELKPDLVIWDHSVNDCCESTGVAKTPDGMLGALEAYRLAIRKVDPTIGLVYFMSMRWSRCEKLHELIDLASRSSNSMFVSSILAMRVTSIFSNQLYDDISAFDVDKNHPNALGHTYLSTVMIHAWTRSFRRYLDLGMPKSLLHLSGDTFSSPAMLTNFETCATPKSFYSAFNAPADNYPAPPESQDWPMFEDRPGKPGWISTTNTSWIEFKLDFGTTPKVIITFLRSYEKMGSIILSMNGISIKLSGLYADPNVKVSQNAIYTISVPVGSKVTQVGAGEHGMNSFGITPESQGVLRFQVDPGTSKNGWSKFKIVSIIAC